MQQGQTSAACTTVMDVQIVLYQSEEEPTVHASAHVDEIQTSTLWIGPSPFLHTVQYTHAASEPSTQLVRSMVLVLSSTKSPMRRVTHT